METLMITIIINHDDMKELAGDLKVEEAVAIIIMVKLALDSIQFI